MTTEQRFTFDGVAERYARARPGYPERLVDFVVETAGLTPASRILELGSGPGNATRLFARRGCRMTCLEPGADLAELARREFDGRPIDVITTTFEDWRLPPEPYDLVLAAQSFHWIDPEVRCAKSADALRPGAPLAVVANRPVLGSEPIDQAVQAAYETHTPEMVQRGIFTNTLDRFGDEIRASGRFGRIEAGEFPWSQDYTSREYVELQGTHSDHLLLPEARRAALLDAVGRAIDEHGGVFTQERIAIAVLAFRA